MISSISDDDWTWDRVDPQPRARTIREWIAQRDKPGSTIVVIAPSEFLAPDRLHYRIGRSPKGASIRIINDIDGIRGVRATDVLVVRQSAEAVRVAQASIRKDAYWAGCVEVW